MKMLKVISVLAVLVSGYAFAQVAATSDQPVLQEVIVTGSRIPVPANITATSPITAVTSEDIKLSGYSDTTDVLNSLPQNIINSANDFGNSSSPSTATGGFATVDLRGLGPQRTLVLVNGRRLGVGDPSTTNSDPAPDIDQIPATLIERIDVVTGGASATYGSDAIAGVVNFILKKDFQGIQIDGQYGFNQHDQHNKYLEGIISQDDPNTGYSAGTPPTGSIRDGNRHDLSVIMGSNFADGNGNVTGYFVYHDQAAVPGYARDFSDCELASNGLVVTPVTNGVECLGSSNSNRFTPSAPAPGAGTRYTVVGNQLLLWPQPGSSPPAQFNFNNYEYLQREDKRYNGGFLAHDDINDFVKPYVEFSFMQDESRAQVAPAGLFTGNNPFGLNGDGNYLINCSNPLLSAQQRGVLCTPAQITADAAAPGSNSADVEIGRRNIEGGGRQSEYRHINFRVVGGMQGDIADGWKYDAYASYYYVDAYAANLNYLNYQSISNALQVTSNASGQPVCVSGGSCVPYNIFNTGAVTAAQLNYLNTPGTSDGNNTQSVAHIDATGDLGKFGLTSPLAKNGLAVNLGGEYRKESVTFSPDAAELSGDLAGFGGASVPTNASYDVGELFAEFRAPLVQDQPGVYDLTTDAGYRWSNYNTSGVTNTYKFEVQYAPIHDARLRFSFDRAVRAPNLVELYNAPSIGSITSPADPCAPTQNGTTIVPATASLAACQHSGVTAAQYGNGGTTNTIPQCIAGQCSEVIEGNSQLKPEVATTWSVGLTFTPADVPGLNATVDYYHIHLEGVVGAIPLGVILNGCISSGNPLYCSQIVRAPNGSISGATVAGGGYILQKEYNLGLSVVSGIDVDVNDKWHLPGDWGSLVTTFNGAWLQHTTSTPYEGAPTFDCAGLFGSTCATTTSGSVNPHWRHNLRIGWETPWNVMFSAQWRFIGPTSFDNNSTDPLLTGVEEKGSNNGPPYYDPYNARIPGYSYFDLAASWHLDRFIELRVGANNVLDKDPPVLPENEISGAAGASNSFQTFDLMGRQIYAAFTAKF
jgi:iron complex outermembrane recepter protein